jgi:acylphosphatase
MAESAENETTLRAIVRGRVQGVGFRWFVVDQARRLALTGKVRNLREGAVEVEARGTRAALELLLEKLREGPTLARVKDVDVEWEVMLSQFFDFDVGY